jgi:ketosteroid isomerase-like protein
MQSADLHNRIRDGINTGDVDALVDCYEPGAVLLAEDGAQAVGLEAIRAAYEAIVSFGGTLTLQTRYAVESGDLAMLSNQYTFSIPGYAASWITAETARRQPERIVEVSHRQPVRRAGGRRLTATTARLVVPAGPGPLFG